MMIGILMVAFLPPLIIAVVLLLERVEESLGATGHDPRPASPNPGAAGHLGSAGSRTD
ncbi:hypothetical protein [Pseudonocardia sp.]|jgi:hypothetical protein|uniref:hypothetical protein n=1 Tax=Pseudonocardia sp. TaxID=60912 RepID=UPI002DAC12BF|nr:hypothetical protein [Pseudonocardia sp.]